MTRASPACALLVAGVTLAGAAQAADQVVLAAGDIASCGSEGDEQTAALLDGLAGSILLLGDIAYPDGTSDDFEECFDPSWGRHKARMFPSPGNHEYHTAGADDYFDYFGALAGDPDEGWYSFELGDWHIVSLNSNCSAIGGCERDSRQGEWLAADLAAHPSACTLAYWHHPRFSSSTKHGSDDDYAELWAILDEHGADLVLVGHDHLYERFAPQDAAGNADADGIREFVVGTGGASRVEQASPEPNSEVREDDTWGVLKLTLQPTSYTWEFVPVAGASFSDSGGANCVGGPAPPPAPDECSAKNGGDVDADGVCGDADNCPSDANPSQADADGDGWGDVCDAGGGTDTLISAANDDAAENPGSGKVKLDGKLLKLGKNSVGLRFTNVGIPPGASIESAFVEFELEKPYTKGLALEIRGQKSGAAGAFEEQPFDVSARAETNASVTWTLAETSGGLKGVQVQRTGDLSAVLEELAATPGWNTSSPVVLVFEGAGALGVPALEGEPPTTARLHFVLAP